MQIRNISLSAPLPGLLSFNHLGNISKKAKSIFLKFTTTIKRPILFFFDLLNISPKKISFSDTSNSRVKKNTFSSKKFFKLGKLLLLIILSFGILNIFMKVISSKPSSRETVEKVEVMGAKAAQELGREFLFPIRDDSGEELSKLKYIIDQVELRDEIVVKGQKLTTVNGKTFLILTLKIVNEYEKPVDINTRDYVRLTVNGNDADRLAPEIHNDPVKVQAISTKFTRVGFPIDEGDNVLMLRVGEIEGDKEKIILDLK